MDANSVSHATPMLFVLQPLAQGGDKAIVQLHNVQRIVRTELRNDLVRDDARAGAHFEDPSRLAVASDISGQGSAKPRAARQHRPSAVKGAAELLPEQSIIGAAIGHAWHSNQRSLKLTAAHMRVIL